ncbi:related to metalloprotease 1 [Cephalotrichum gorgonifer]|uniref:Presequence protease, mitochondrial n=1 Tax=Cephalotrichum gorgonifer TaxID=2041049 RepID=A0AAE8MS94_9PEZI|nr:related to metalloprotease 1 [Cephalotrichum gorgonifer]
MSAQQTANGQDAANSPPKSVGHFKQKVSFKTEFAPSQVTQYVSERSGMHVVVADRKGPKVIGNFGLATEILDDSGAPHTLEHLIFMGSKNYHYKGLLDKLASRAYSSTNAWTATDHTAYTLDTAGWDGFAQILPVYLEHVLLPIITDEACTTEVWHVDGEGNDAGVVYSEMQGVQYRSPELIDLAARRLLYPENVGFRYETGGMMEALRVLTPERIREFHREMYQPRNLCVIVVGEVDHVNLLEILEEFEESIKDHIPALDSPFKRPWIDSVQPPAIKETVVETIEFPEEDLSVGELSIAFFGPKYNDIVDYTALLVLLTYLCGSSASVLENTIVEKEKLASSIQYYTDSRPNTVLWLQATGVKTDRLEKVEKRIIDLLREVAEKPLDMVYLKSCFDREVRQIKFHAEESYSFFSSAILDDYLFGKRDGSTLKLMQNLDEYTALLKWTESDWRNFLKKWLVDANHISVLGKPSIEMANRLKEEEKARIAKRKEDLGPEGLAKLAKTLEAAKEKNEQPIPEEVIERWGLPTTESIHFIKSTTARAGRARALGTTENEAQTILDKSGEGKHPLFLQFEHVPSNFIHITVYAGTNQLPVELKPLSGIFNEGFFNTHATHKGKQMTFEEVVVELESETISYEIHSARQVGDPDGLALSFAIEPEKYAVIIEWMKTLMFNATVDEQRLKTIVGKLLADVPEAKREGNLMAGEIVNAYHIDRSTMAAAKRNLVKALHLRRLKKLLEKEPQTVVDWVKSFYRSVFAPGNLRVLVTGDVSKIPNPVGAWDIIGQEFDSSGSSQEGMVPIRDMLSRLSEEGKKPGSVGAVIVPMATLDTSFSTSVAKGVESLRDPRVPALMVAISYLETPEGPLWKAVRGQGYAYGTYFAREIETGLLQYKVYRSPDVTKAIAASQETIRAIAEGDVPIDKHFMEAAVSQIVVLFAGEQSTMAAAAVQNFLLGVVRGLPLDWTEQVLAKVRAVRAEDMKEAMRELLLPCFEAGKSNVVITCAPNLKEDIEKAMASSGYKTQTKQLADFYDAYGLEGDDAADLEEEEEEEEEEESGLEGSESGSESDSEEEE